MKSIYNIKLLIAPITGWLVYCLLTTFSNCGPVASKMAAVAVWIAIWWLTEVINMAVTALLPMVLFPLLGILDSKTTAIQYMDTIIFLFIGGFIIAFAIEKWMLHERIALKILMRMGKSTSQILLGVMLTSFCISMWISNTATVMMLFSCVMAIIYRLEKHLTDELIISKIAAALLIGLAYSASIGGMATLVGTPTNMIFYREYMQRFPQNNDLNFFSWFIVAFPLALVFLFATFWILKKLFLNNTSSVSIDSTYFHSAYKNLGKISYEEKCVGFIFCITAVLWFTRADIELDSFKIKGWSNLFEKPDFISDATVAIFMALLLFLIPSRSQKGKALMGWEDVAKLPFDIILLFGGGFALAKGMESSGFTTWLGQHLGFVSGINIYLFIGLMCLLITIISEFASNVACIQLMLPILISLQKEMNIHPLLLMIPATLAASLGFMLPVATAPNTIVFGSKRIKVADMFKAGLLVDIIGIVLITITMLVYSFS